MPFDTDTKSLPHWWLDKRSKLLPCQREQIVNMFYRGATYAQLANQYNVSKRTICNILNPKTQEAENNRRRKNKSWEKYDKDANKVNVSNSRKRKKVIYDIFLGYKPE